MKRWLIDTSERAVKTFAQVFVSMLTLGGLFDVSTVDKLSVLKIAAMGGASAALSVLSSALSTLRGDPQSASAVK